MLKNHPLIKIITCLSLGLAISIAGCIDPFEIELEGGQEFLVVDGEFTPENRAHELVLYRTISQIARQRTPVLGADITLIDEAGKRADYIELDEGKYQLPANLINGETGKDYFVEIKLRTGEEYRSQPAKMPKLIKGDSTYIRYNQLDEILLTGRIIQRSFLEVFVDTPLPTGGEDYWLKWDVTTLYSFPEVICSPLAPPPLTCFISGNTDPQQVTLLNGERFDKGRLEGFKVNDKRLGVNDFEYRGKHYFIVNQQSISKETYEYWDKINRLSNQSGSIFDTPPAAIQGNIYNVNDPEEVILGYFELSHTDVLRQFVSANSLGNIYRFPTNVCPTLLNPFNSSFFRECCGCLRIENATLDRPSWF